MALVLLLLLRCAPAEPRRAVVEDGPPVDGDWVVAPLGAEPASLHPLLVTDKPSIEITRLIADSLVDHGPDLKYVPRLAESWEISPDGRVVTFHLRQGVRWHDGEPLSSADVLFTYRAAADPATGASRLLSDFSLVESVEAPDDHTVVVTYDAPFSPALQGWEKLLILPRHLFPDGEVTGDDFGRQPIGSGPFRLHHWTSGQEVVLEANEDYWRGRPHLDRVVFRVIPDARTAWGALLAGELDLTVVPSGDETPDADRLPGDRQLRLQSAASLGVEMLLWNADGSNPFFADRRVRRAMTLALDRQGFLAAVLHGRGTVATSTFPPGTWAHHDGIEPLPHDPGEAARLLEEAGWHLPEGESVRRKAGTPFRFTALYYQKNVDRGRVALLLQDALGRIGVQMEVVPLEWAALLERVRDRRFESLVHGWSLDLDPDPFDFFHSSQHAAGMNYFAYIDADVDRWIEAGRRTFDLAERAALYRRVQERLHRDQPVTFLYHRKPLISFDARLRNFRSTATGVWRWFPGVVEWWVPETLQRYPVGAP